MSVKLQKMLKSLQQNPTRYEQANGDTALGGRGIEGGGIEKKKAE